MKQLILETKRLILIPIAKEHIEYIFKSFTPVTAKYMTVSHGCDYGEIKAAVERYIQQGKAGTDFVYAIMGRETDVFMGVVGIDRLKTRVPEAWIWLKEEAYENGYGKEVIEKIIFYVKDLGYQKLYYPVDKNNFASKQIPLHFGGKMEGCKEIVTSDGRTLCVGEYYVSL